MSLSSLSKVLVRQLRIQHVRVAFASQVACGRISERHSRQGGVLLESRKFYSSPPSAKSREQIAITFIDRDGDKRTVQANVGDTLLDVAKDNDIDVEGACEGTLSCSTCHLIFPKQGFEDLPIDPPSEEELDMLDLAYGVTETSRLGCQIFVTKDMENITLKVPTMTRDVRD